MLNAANWTARLNELATGANVTGAALGIWSDGQQILAAHGVLNSATQVPVTTDSVFQVGSITKIWTATMIMQLVDEGLLSLDTTVAEVLPGARLGTADVSGQATVRHLLTHTSGIDGDIFTDTGRGDECVVRNGQLRMVLTMTGNLAALTDSEPEDLVLYPAEPPDPAGPFNPFEPSDSPGTRFVLRSRDDEPWVPLSFSELGDGTPYIYLSGRVTPRTGLGRLQELPPGRPAVTRGWSRQAGMVAM